MSDKDQQLVQIDVQRARLRSDFMRDMTALDDFERELLGLRPLRRDEHGLVLGFADETVG